MSNSIKIEKDRTKQEFSRRQTLLDLYNECPIPDDEILSQLALFIPKVEFARILYIHDLYKKILDVHGVIMEFGVRWGQNLALFDTFRGIYEPFNSTRKIIGFDTFAGFPSVDPKDGSAEIIQEGAYSVTERYEEYLTKLMDLKEQEGIASRVKKYELVKGDATVEIDDYLNNHPETIVSLAYFDFDIYAPTKKCLESVKGYLTRGSIVAFDELNVESYPGETVALKEVFGLDKYKLVHTPFSSARSYFVVE